MGDRPGSSAWKSLHARAVASLDEDGMEAFAKSRERLGCRRERAVAELGKAPYDFYMVQEILVEFDRCGRFDEAVALCGGSEGECVAARGLDADIDLVWGFVEGNVVRRMKAKAMDIAQAAQAELKKAVEDGGRKSNVKALELALAGTMPGLYGKSGRGGRSGDEESRKGIPVGGGGIMINVIGDAAMKLLKPAVEGRAGGVFIDV